MIRSYLVQCAMFSLPWQLVGQALQRLCVWWVGELSVRSLFSLSRFTANRFGVVMLFLSDDVVKHDNARRRNEMAWRHSHLFLMPEERRCLSFSLHTSCSYISSTHLSRFTRSVSYNDWLDSWNILLLLVWRVLIGRERRRKEREIPDHSLDWSAERPEKVFGNSLNVNEMWELNSVLPQPWGKRRELSLFLL